MRRQIIPISVAGRVSHVIATEVVGMDDRQRFRSEQEEFQPPSCAECGEGRAGRCLRQCGQHRRTDV